MATHVTSHTSILFTALWHCHRESILQGEDITPSVENPYRASLQPHVSIAGGNFCLLSRNAFCWYWELVVGWCWWYYHSIHTDKTKEMLNNVYQCCIHCNKQADVSFLKLVRYSPKKTTLKKEVLYWHKIFSYQFKKARRLLIADQTQ